MGKRKSGATDAPGGGKASKKTMELPSIPAADMKKQVHMKLFDEWLTLSLKLWLSTIPMSHNEHVYSSIYSWILMPSKGCSGEHVWFFRFVSCQAALRQGQRDVALRLSISFGLATGAGHRDQVLPIRGEGVPARP